MTYYSNKDWWDTRFKIRRSLTITPFSFLPGSESHCAVKLKKTDINGKIKPDYSDLNLIFQPEGDSPSLLPHYVIDEGTEISVVFEPTLPVPASQDEYFLYYSGKSDTKLSDRTDYLDPNNLYLIDYGQLDDSTKWTFQKPSINWVQNISIMNEAVAVFKFIGHKADLYFHTGPTYGKFRYQINDGESTEVDCYSGIESVSKVALIDTNIIETTKIKIESLGDKNPAASSDKVRLDRVNFHQILLTVPESEEFYSLVGKAVTTGA